VIRPVFAFPPFPEGWRGGASRLIRIVDPAGDAIAWLDPSRGACVGFAVREATGDAPSRAFRHLLAVIPPDTGDDGPETSSFDPGPRWRFVDRDPASCTLGCQADVDGPTDAVLMTASLDDGILSLAYRLPASAPPSPLRVTLVCTSNPTIRSLAPGRERAGHCLGVAAGGDLVISHGNAFTVSSTPMITGPDVVPRFIVTLELLPRPELAGPECSGEHSILVYARTT
jgi:hypothetical protein